MNGMISHFKTQRCGSRGLCGLTRLKVHAGRKDEDEQSTKPYLDQGASFTRSVPRKLDRKRSFAIAKHYTKVTRFRPSTYQTPTWPL
jgi:hypothetical protein